MIKPEVIAEMGESIYQNNKEMLEKKYFGKIIALCEEGVAGIGNTIDETLEEAEKNYPDKVFYLRRIGPNPVCGHML